MDYDAASRQTQGFMYIRIIQGGFSTESCLYPTHTSSNSVVQGSARCEAFSGPYVSVHIRTWGVLENTCPDTSLGLLQVFNEQGQGFVILFAMISQCLHASVECSNTAVPCRGGGGGGVIYQRLLSCAMWW